MLFYTWGEPKYVLLLIAMSVFDWAFALKIEKSRECGKNAGKVWLVLACVVNIGLIGLFKYAGMFCSFFGTVPDFISRIALPLGISFYTFQLLTYVVDVYRGDAHAEKKFWHVLLYAALFHQCIAGPIVRYNAIAEELFVERDGRNEMPEGVFRFTTGLVKKVILANSCGSVAEMFLLADSSIEDASQFAANISQLNSTPVIALWVGAICYALQIYYDFSAYSDMAIGLGKMLGLHYPENFNYPYIAENVTDFWRRWHISLSTFFRDYVYIPLGGNRKGGARTILNLFVVWALTGLWHGASWNFVLWGLYFFIFLLTEKYFFKKNTHKPEKEGSVFGHIYLVIVVLFGWILFRYTDMRYIPVVIKGMFGANGNAFLSFEYATILKNNMFIIAFCILAATPMLKTAFEFVFNIKPEGRGTKLANVIKYAIAPVCFLLLSTAALVGASYNPFLYYRF